ncbi:EAL domain-containing protein [Chitinibacter bivalviorum]|uniref:EAL domain-containing protein n=1 Tax=Chitinibacter bivalviorum TaxID=2739434 RepID=A0A7H9BJZ2_9NEIS|nr:bifunctional diguanylate cyclase/phosphodiesterase [Chitinibacter bivalviorum]QLG88789.1 EAL domain-containing protein [Chitinibacter bivalviorum]
MQNRPIFTSLRARLIAASILVQCVLLAVLFINTSRIWTDMVQHATEVRIQELSRLLSAAFTTPLATGDLAKAGDLLDGIRSTDGIDYLVLLDEKQQIIAARGWDVSQKLPPATSNEVLGEQGLALIHAVTRIEQGGEALGELHYGVSNLIMHDAASRLVWQSGLALVIGLLCMVVLMAMLGVWLTRHLYRIISAAETASQGHFEALAEPSGNDEVSQITRRFNEMSRSIRDRVQALSQSEAKFHAIADHTYSAELWLDPTGKLVWINASIERLTGYSVNECMILPDFPLSLATPEERSRFDLALKDALQERGIQQDYEFRAVKRDGSLFWASVSWMPLISAQGQYQGLRASLRDNSEMKDDRLALRKAVVELRQIQSLGQSYLQRAESERARMLALLAAMRFGVLFLDNENRLVFFNPAFCELWGISSADLLSHRPIGQVLQQADNRPAMGDILSIYLEELSLMEDRVDFGEVTMNDGRIVTQNCYRVLDPKGQTNGRMWVYEDVTQQRALAEHMVNLAERDALTGLYNRHRFQQELERMVSEADRRQQSMALVFFDLDEFKHVNDSFGHAVGDELLKAIAREVGKQVRRHEVLSRLGGDEFAVLLPECGEFEVTKLAERIVSSISQIQFMAGSHLMRPGTSVGVALYPQHANNAEDLVAHADSAMYQAKAAGKGTWRLYHPDADHSRNELTRLSWKERIIDALEHDGFELHFQGIYHCHDKSLAHLEALVRMKDEGSPGGVIMPNNFIPHAEKTGKILDLDRWVIQRVIRQLADFPDCPSIAVNVSGRSFDDPDLPKYIHALLVQYGVSPKRLLVELTETSAVSDMTDAQRFIDALRATGCVVCLDDFGVGFASFAYLKQLKADVLKIDGLFIRDLQNDADSQVFVRGMVSIAHDLGKTTIAEFVENEVIFNMLVEFGVDQVQGYWLDKPQRDHPGLR